MKKLMISLLIVLSGTKVGAQWGPYQKPLKGVDQDWHRVEIPYHLFDSLREDLADIRLYAITRQTDTLVVPYYIQSKEPNIQKIRHITELINSGQTPDGWAFTLMADSVETTNRIELEIPEANFNWQVELAGSNDQQDWVILLKDYPLVGIQNQWTSYKFTDLHFKPARFRYYRVLLQGASNLNLQKAYLIYEQSAAAEFYTLSLDQHSSRRIIDDGRVFHDYHLPDKLPVSALKVTVADDLDYHRRFEVWYSQFPAGTDVEGPALDDYRYLSAGVLSSTRPNYFHFSPQSAKQLKLVVYEEDNQPLHIQDLTLMYEKQYLVARFPKAQNYYFTFGDHTVSAPHYDLVHFKSLDDGSLPILSIGPTAVVKNPASDSTSTWWLWLVLGVSMLVIGRFTWQLLTDDSQVRDSDK